MNFPSSLAFSPGKDFAALRIFQGIEPEILRELMGSAHTAQFQKGAVFLAQGEPVSRNYIVLEGWCGASRGNPDGQESLLQLFHHGDLLLDPAPRGTSEICPFNLQALTPVRLLALAAGALRLAIERSHALAANLLTASLRAGQQMRDHIDQLTLHTAEQRVGRFLLQTLFGAGAESSDIVLPFDKALIAAYLNIKPETFSRMLQNFRKQGFVIERSHIKLPSRTALCAYCDKTLLRACPVALLRGCPLLAEKGNPSTSTPT